MPSPDRHQSAETNLERSPASTPEPVRTLGGIHPLKWVFALEYVLQGLANPFQGITYQSFFRHFRTDFGLTEGATQSLFAKSYLAWSFKPIIGFLIDAYGRTRTLLLFLLSAATFGYLVAPLIDKGPMLFFFSMFALSMVMAATDVTVDRATIIDGDSEARTSGRSRSTTVGLNQAICWTAIYGTSIVSAVAGGYLADHLPIHWLLLTLALVPVGLLLVVKRLPRDRAVPIPIRRSLTEFWVGLHSGPILAVMTFYLIFHFQPAMGALWTHHLLTNLRFTQTDLGIADGAGYVGSLLGVLWFSFRGVRLQDRFGLRTLFRWYILGSVLLGFTQYMLVEPWFSGAARGVRTLLPFSSEHSARLLYLALYQLLSAIPAALIRMSTFSLVGAVIPVAAAGSLFAGFMSMANLGYSFSYSTGAWLYEHGLDFEIIRSLQAALFGIPGRSGDSLSIQVLILINSVAVLVSFLCVHLLPDRKQTLAAAEDEVPIVGPERWTVLGSTSRRVVNLLALTAAFELLAFTHFVWGVDWVSACLLTFLTTTVFRKSLLDLLLRRRLAQGCPAVRP